MRLPSRILADPRVTLIDGFGPDDEGGGVFRFSTRAVNCLECAGLNTAKRVASSTSRELLKIRNFGTTCLKDVVRSLAEMGMCLADQPIDTPSGGDA